VSTRKGKNKGNPLPFDYAATDYPYHVTETQDGSRRCHAIQYFENGHPNEIYIEIVFAENSEEARSITLNMFPGANIVAVETVESKRRENATPGARFINGRFVPVHSH